ncbi:MAG: right-handed parallel beta-helix repeat-containing protein, partial [Phycisphaerae bacterium]
MQNLAGNNGGGWRLTGTATPLVQRCTFDRNKSNDLLTSIGFGGGLYCGGNTAIIEDCVFTDNTASHNAGGLYVQSGNPSVTRCRFERITSSAQWHCRPQLLFCHSFTFSR